MRNLNFFLQPFGCLGIPNHARSFGEAMINNLDHVNLIPINKNHLNDQYGLTEKIISNFRDPNNDYDSLIFWYPENYRSIFDNFLTNKNPSTKKYGYFIFEYTIIPKSYVDELNKLDGVCSASQWAVDVLKNNGVTVPLYVIPGGVDHSIFNSNERQLDSKRFKFLHIGKAEKRKGTDIVIRSFNEAFKGDRKIRLSLFIDNPHVREFNADMFLNEIKEGLNLKYPVTNIDVRHFEHSIISAYNTHHAAVFASKAEGIGLPIVEAMACGMPVIVPLNSGITAYATESNAILIKDLVEEDIYDTHFYPVKGELGKWNVPKVSDMVEKMKWVYENYSDAQKIGDSAEQYMKENYSWDIAAKKMLNIP